MCDYDQGEAQVKVVIRQRLAIGIVKLVRTEILVTKGNQGCLTLLKLLGSTIAKQQTEQQLAHQQQT